MEKKCAQVIGLPTKLKNLNQIMLHIVLVTRPLVLLACDVGTPSVSSEALMVAC